LIISWALVVGGKAKSLTFISESSSSRFLFPTLVSEQTAMLWKLISLSAVHSLRLWDNKEIEGTKNKTKDF
jgi:hypothetical protein